VIKLLPPSRDKNPEMEEAFRVRAAIISQMAANEKEKLK
jgi:hypothetical protein